MPQTRARKISCAHQQDYSLGPCLGRWYISMMPDGLSLPFWFDASMTERLMPFSVFFATHIYTDDWARRDEARRAPPFYISHLYLLIIMRISIFSFIYAIYYSWYYISRQIWRIIFTLLGSFRRIRVISSGSVNAFVDARFLDLVGDYFDNCRFFSLSRYSLIDIFMIPGAFDGLRHAWYFPHLLHAQIPSLAIVSHMHTSSSFDMIWRQASGIAEGFIWCESMASKRTFIRCCSL